jgi:excisionase family DNA binding protein
MEHERTLKDSATRRELLSFLTTEEVLAYLKVTPRTIYRLIRTGELPAVRIGRQWRFRRGDLDSWLDRQRHSAAS